MLQRCFLRPCSEEGSDAAKPWHGFGENTDCGNREEINKLTLRFLGWASSHQQTWTIEWKQTLNNRWSQQRRYVTGRLQWYPQDTAESFVKWSSAGLLHSPANVRVLEMKFYICSDVTHTHTACVLFFNVHLKAQPSTMKRHAWSFTEDLGRGHCAAGWHCMAGQCVWWSHQG